jgi:uncharacterized C2H2 Zn-finger protein
VMANHIRSQHTNESSFMCAKCGQNFKQRQVYNSHLLLCENT